MSKPLVKRTDGIVLYVDRADAATLKSIYQDSPYYDVADFVDIDVVWHDQPLSDVLPEDFRADYIIASHVIEHVPDLIRWLDNVSMALAPGGQIRLAIPDKRFIFDRFRKTTVLPEILAAWIRKDIRPGAQAILDDKINFTEVDVQAIWQGRAAAGPEVPIQTIGTAIAVALQSTRDELYEDAHCWVFTPAAFVDAMLALARLDLIKLGCRRFVDTPEGSMEFYADLEPMETAGEVVDSWRTAASLIRREPSYEPDQSDKDRRIEELNAAFSELSAYVERSITTSDPDRSDASVPYCLGLKVRVTPDIVTRSIWRYQELHASTEPTLIQFLPDGYVGLHRHLNQARWGIDNGQLRFIRQDGVASTIFDQSFFHKGRLVLRGAYQFDAAAKSVFELRQLEPSFAPPTTIPTRDRLKSQIEVFGWEIGEHTYGSPLVLESGLAHLRIGRYCSIADDVKITLGNHRTDLISTYPFPTLSTQWPTAPDVEDHTSRGDVLIGHDVWIGTAAIILSGVTIGNGAVIGAGAVVTADVPAYGIVIGNPARLSRYRFPDNIIKGLQDVAWWGWDDAAVAENIKLIVSTDPGPLFETLATSRPDTGASSTTEPVVSAETGTVNQG
ncbi:methyltransferase domain-containing protein [Lichenihabitans psoromatis]|uniref:methyltransferase domain-containing protein n=1 Tax=Lichenihabitans psoromatis TaxID=2528642 RepID=UPI0013F17DEA|nr:methyltransferase domain-containing protein [Lichenihabitans psoromatis]